MNQSDARAAPLCGRAAADLAGDGGQECPWSLNRFVSQLEPIGLSPPPISRQCAQRDRQNF